MSPMTSGSMPRPSDSAKAAFQALLPAAGDVATRPMFGNLAAFVNGNMFAGLFGDQLFVRLPGEGREQVLAGGGADFSPMPGRAMREYVTVPEGWLQDPGSAAAWVERALAFTREMPARTSKPRKAKAR